MTTKKSLTLNGLVLPNFLFAILSLFMIFVGAYLTNHFFSTHYPTGITGSSSLCNINSFWACDKATESSFATIFGMPTSIFGIIMGVIGIFTSFAGSEKVEKTTKSILLINLIACLGLFIYSVAILKSLCPMCTAYYVLSLLSYFLFWKYSDAKFGVDPKTLGIFALVVIIPIGAMNGYINGKEKAKSSLALSYINQFNNLKDYGDPSYESPYKIHMGTKEFSDAPIRISVFSDFQCPYCQSVSDQMPELVKEFKEKINIQYMFYPLDASCNTKMKGAMHPYACYAAYLAACDESKFSKVHDYIFKNQEIINTENIKKWAKKFDIDQSCLEDKKIQDRIQQTLNTGNQYNLQSTPTIIINGKKLEGLVPTVHLKAILKSLIK